MAAKLTIQDAPAKATETRDFVAGIRKVGPNSYRVVTGLIVDGMASLKVDAVEQPLEHAAETLKIAFRKLLAEAP